MLRSVLDTHVVQTARTALGGLARREQAVAANVANIDTPHYT